MQKINCLHVKQRLLGVSVPGQPCNRAAALAVRGHPRESWKFATLFGLAPYLRQTRRAVAQHKRIRLAGQRALQARERALAT